MPLEQPRPAVVLKNLALKRPLAIIDLETTGRDVKEDRIVEISVLRIQPDGTTEHRTRRCHPGRPIPAEVTEVHGITDADVENEPPFHRLARGLLDFLDGCDLCGYNIRSFDLRVLYAEFERANLTFDLEGRAIVDPMTIFMRQERRDLTSAVRFYLNRDFDDAHSAKADVLATIEVLDAMLGRYTELPNDVTELHALEDKGNRRTHIGVSGMLTKAQGEIRFVKGKHRGVSLAFVAANDPGYLLWLLDSDFCNATKLIVQQAQQQARPAMG